MIRIVEVGPRYGLQNEPTPIDTSIKLEYIQNLIGAGVREIEVTSFVSPKYVPQLADSMDLWKQLPPGPLYSALVPNRRGLENAMSVGVERICLFTATSDAFTQKNINMTVDQSLAEFAEVIRDFRNHTPKSWIRLYMSTAFHCPYSGTVSAQVASEKISRAMELDVDELSIGDTTGYGIPQDVRNLDSLLNLCKEKVAWHFHDTRGMAIANVQVALALMRVVLVLADALTRQEPVEILQLKISFIFFTVREKFQKSIWSFCLKRAPRSWQPSDARLLRRLRSLNWR